MNQNVALEILHSIAETCLDSPIVDGDPIGRINDVGCNEELSRAIQLELGAVITAGEIQSSPTLIELARLLEARLAIDSKGRTLLDFYVVLGRLAREEYHPKVRYHWYAHWDDFLKVGNWLTAPDPLDAVEMVMRLEAEFGFGISDRDAKSLETVGVTVRYIFRRSLEQEFILRGYSADVCPSAFVFYELRRLLIVRGGVPREAVKLSARLDELLPSWYAQFWQQVQDIFRVPLHRGHLLPLMSRIEKRTTVNELVDLIISSQTFVTRS